MGAALSLTLGMIVPLVAYAAPRSDAATSPDLTRVSNALHGVGSRGVDYDHQTAELYLRSYSAAGTIGDLWEAVDFMRDEQRAAEHAFAGAPLGSIVCETNSPDWNSVLRVTTTARTLRETEAAPLLGWLARSVLETRAVDSSVWVTVRHEDLGKRSQSPN